MQNLHRMWDSCGGDRDAVWGAALAQRNHTENLAGAQPKGLAEHL